MRRKKRSIYLEVRLSCVMIVCSSIALQSSMCLRNEKGDVKQPWMVGLGKISWPVSGISLEGGPLAGLEMLIAPYVYFFLRGGYHHIRTRSVIHPSTIS